MRYSLLRVVLKNKKKTNVEYSSCRNSHILLFSCDNLILIPTTLLKVDFDNIFCDVKTNKFLI